MDQELIIEHPQQLRQPVLVVGFSGWANGGNVSVGMLDYLIQTLGATRFASIPLNRFCPFDDVRPMVKIHGGQLQEILLPEAVFYCTQGTQGEADLVLLKADEPHFRWDLFVETVLSLCHQMAVELIISLGGLQDNVVHTDAIVSGIASSQELLDCLQENEVVPIDYEGPGAIHSLILQKALARGIQGISLWGHCPFYVQGTHLRVLSRMATILSNITGLYLDTTELEKGWMQLARQIQSLVDENPELQKAIKELSRSKTVTEPPEALKDNVIYLDDVFGPKRKT